MTPYELIANADAAYLDTSALVKVDAKQEHGSSFIRVLVYLSKIPAYSSFVGFGEFVCVVGKKEFAARARAERFLFVCRQLMIDFDQKEIRRAEPVEDKLNFARLARKLMPKYGHWGGGDIWHLMAALHLKRQIPRTVFVSFDTDLVRAAQAEGLDALDCNGLDSSGQLHTYLRASKKAEAV
jgi:predicted nucleic acid-binding protein